MSCSCHVVCVTLNLNHDRFWSRIIVRYIFSKRSRSPTACSNLPVVREFRNLLDIIIPWGIFWDKIFLSHYLLSKSVQPLKRKYLRIYTFKYGLSCIFVLIEFVYFVHYPLYPKRNIKFLSRRVTTIYVTENQTCCVFITADFPT